MESSLEALRSRIRVPEGKSFLIGLSGGADSVALTMMLLPEIRKGAMRATAVHVNHGLRSAESDGDHGMHSTARRYVKPGRTPSCWHTTRTTRRKHS